MHFASQNREGEKIISLTVNCFREELWAVGFLSTSFGWGWSWWACFCLGFGGFILPDSFAPFCFPLRSPLMLSLLFKLARGERW